MILGRVVGTVVTTQKDASLTGQKLLVVQPVDIISFKDSGPTVVALDVIGAGQNEVVMVVGGSSARLAEGLENKVPTDQSITAIVDAVEIMGGTVFTKTPS